MLTPIEGSPDRGAGKRRGGKGNITQERIRRIFERKTVNQKGKTEGEGSKFFQEGLTND